MFVRAKKINIYNWWLQRDNFPQILFWFSSNITLGLPQKAQTVKRAKLYLCDIQQLLSVFILICPSCQAEMEWRVKCASCLPELLISGSYCYSLSSDSNLNQMESRALLKTDCPCSNSPLCQVQILAKPNLTLPYILKPSWYLKILLD